MYFKNKKDSSSASGNEEKMRSIHYKFLAVFWTFRFADWMQGPYFYEVYASKKYDDGTPFSAMTIAILFLCGFISSGICGTFVGTLVDRFGRKKGCVAFCVIYSLSAMSTRSNSLFVLVMGRVLGGIATSLLESAPESWFVRQHELENVPGNLMGKCFGWAWFGNSIVAIVAGQMASAVATRGDGDDKEDPSAPFMLSVCFLMFGLVLVLSLWKENFGSKGNTDSNMKDQIVDTWNKIMSDDKIKYVGAVQSLYEGSMYVFVLAWAPTVKAFAAEGEIVPFGKIFSCFMVSCMIGSSLFGEFLSFTSVENFMPKVLFVASASLALSSILQNVFTAVIVGFLLFEGTVGLYVVFLLSKKYYHSNAIHHTTLEHRYFPSINTLRSSYIPNTIRSTAMNIFRVPLNMIVVTLNLSVKTIGTSGALIASSGLLLMAALAQTRLLKLYVFSFSLFL